MVKFHLHNQFTKAYMLNYQKRQFLKKPKFFNKNQIPTIETAGPIRSYLRGPFYTNSESMLAKCFNKNQIPTIETAGPIRSYLRGPFYTNSESMLA